MNRCRYRIAFVLFMALLCCPLLAYTVQAAPTEAENGTVLGAYEAYYERLMSIPDRDGIEACGFRVVEDQIFALYPDEEDSLFMVPAFDEQYNRLALFLVDA